MNELIFFSQILVIIFFLFAAVQFGKMGLFCLGVILSITANLFVLKQMTIFSMNVTCADSYAVGAIIGLNLIQEYFGKEEANRFVWINFFCMIFFALMSQFHLLYVPSCEDWSHSSFSSLLSASPRILIASLISYLISQKMDVELFSRLRKKFKKSYLLPVMIISIFTTQMIDTCLFSFLGLYGIVSSLFEIIVLSMIVKIIIIVVMSTCTSIYRLKKLNYEI
ncbi:MAG: queuosine precursor transporter [Chlamydiales bacterium]|nr:queuosine precursor transporter [Chlamydiales bacterium]